MSGLAQVRHDLRSALDRINQLGLFPEAAMRILQVTQDSDATLEDLERAVASDPVLTARVLQVANSPLYGFSKKIGTLRRAVQMLGMEGTRGVSFALAVSSIGTEGPLAHGIYLHAIAASAFVCLVAPLVAGVHGSMLFATTLVHNLGLQLLLVLEPESSEALLDKFGHGPLLIKAERVHFGFDHAQLGAAGLREWGLPDPAVAIVEQHHDPVPKTHRSRAIVRVADECADLLLAGETSAEIAKFVTRHPLTEPFQISEFQWMQIVDALPDAMAELTV